MSLRSWAGLIVLVLLSIGIDQATKGMAEGFAGELRYGIFVLQTIHNPGVMLGHFAELPLFIRTVALSTSGSFLVFVFGILQALIPIRAASLRSGLSLVLGGILGNVVDRISRGYVIDMLCIDVFGAQNRVIFNLADVFQWIGYALIAWGVAKHGRTLWPDVNHRKQLWVHPGYQARFILILMGTGAAFALIAGVFGFTFLKVSLSQFAPALRDAYLRSFILAFAAVTCFYLAGLGWLGLVLSHRVAGPVHALNRFLRDVISGKRAPDATFQLRANDEFKSDIEQLGRHVAGRLSPRPQAVPPPFRHAFVEPKLKNSSG